MHYRLSAYFLIAILAASIVGGIFIYQPLWVSISSFRPWHLGLDLSGGTFLVYEIDLSGIKGVDKDSVVDGLRDVIERRVNLFGISEPRVYVQSIGNEYRLVAELAGIRDVNEAIKEIGETPILDFREVEEVDGKLEFKKTELTGRYIKGAGVAFDNVTRRPYVTLEMTDEGAKIFEEITVRNVGKKLAIFLDNFPIEMPVVQEKITGGRAQITGNFTLEEAKTLVQRFNAGALPAPIKLINQYTVSPELGHDSLQKIILAGILGLISVVLYLIIYYRRLGIYAAIALLVYVIFLLSIFKLAPVTLTLAGIAGAVLSVGMAVDANILVFERIKEEIKKGSSYSAAVEEGFKRAWSSIRDANITTIISSITLYYLTTSFVKGFALALLIGVVLSMFSAVILTKSLLRVFMRD